MKIKIIYLIVFFVIICFVVGGIYYFNYKNNINNKIASIIVRYDSPDLSDSGMYEKYSIYKNKSNKYIYVKEHARVTFGGKEDYEYEDTGTIESNKDLESLFNDIYSKEIVYDEEEKKRQIEESGRKNKWLPIEEYVYLTFVYDGNVIGEDTGEPLSYEERKEIDNRNFEQFENLLFK